MLKVHYINSTRKQWSNKMAESKTMEKGQAGKVTKTVPSATASQKASQNPKSASSSASKHTGKNIAVVLIRGSIDMTQPLKDALRVLGLHHKNHCVVVNDNPVTQGMINKVKDYITWGEITEQTFQEMVEKRGKEFKARETDSKKKYSYRVLQYNSKKYKPYFALNPPRKGYGRKGIKVAFRASGALGYRGEKINDLLKRMI